MFSNSSVFTKLLKQLKSGTKKPQRNKASSMVFEELDPRTLYSVDPFLGLIDTDELSQQSFIEANLIESSSSDIQTNVPQAEIETNNIRHELVVIDSNVTNHSQLLKDILVNQDPSKVFSIVVLNNEENGIQSISDQLANYTDLDALHIISHGTENSITLGNAQLNSTNLVEYSELISHWKTSFNSESDLLIYGCELAGNSQGQHFISQLASLTQTDVAASIDNTGHSKFDANWDLEFVTGVVETEMVINHQTQQQWEGLLAIETYRDEFSTISYSNNDGSLNWANDWQEIGESNGPANGHVSIGNLLGEDGLIIRQKNNGISRTFNLPNTSNTTLSFDYARRGLGTASHEFTLHISDNGGTSWVQLDSWQGPAHDTSLLSASYDLSAYSSNNTQIRFLSSNSVVGNDKFFIDNIQVSTTPSLSPSLFSQPEFTAHQPEGAIQQETNGQNRGSQQAVSMANNGDYVVVWTEVQETGDLSDVFAHRFYANGTEKEAEFQVNTHITDNQQWASVATDASGRFIIAWTSENQDGDGQGIYFRRFDAQGNAIDNTDILLNSTDNSGDQNDVSIAINSQGKIVATWYNDESIISNRGVYAQVFDISTNTVNNQLPASIPLITLEAGDNLGNPSVDINSEGKFVIVWEKGTDIFAQRFDSANNFRGSPVKVNLNSAQFPVVAIQETGDYIVAFRSEIILIEGVWLKHHNDDGSSNGPSNKVSNFSEYNHTSPSISKDVNDNFIITYQGSGDGDGIGIFGRKYDSDHNALGNEFLVNETTVGDQRMASIAMLDTDNFVVVWSGNGSEDPNGVYARQFGTAINHPPLADASAGLPYEINEGDSLILNASNSSDPDLDLLSYSWDLDGNGSFGDVSGENITVNWSILQSFGINDNGIYTIGLQVSDGNGAVDTTTATLTVNNTAPILGTTGSTTIAQGAVYRLNLSVTELGDDTITSWTINWGDGSIETFAGNPSFVEHTYLNGGFTNNILASAIDEDGKYLQNELLVPSYQSNSIFRFEPTTGEFSYEFPSNSDSKKPIEALLGPDGLLYFSFEGSNEVLRYNASTGAFIDVFIDGSNIPQLSEVEGIAFGADGTLYVADYGNDKVLQFDVSGNYIKDFVTSGSGGLRTPFDILFGADNNLYVGDYTNHIIYRYDGETGDFIDQFVTAQDGGLDTPTQMTFGPDGHLYVSSHQTEEVLRFDGVTGNFIDIFIPKGATSIGLQQPEGIAFGPDGNLYVADFKDGAILRYDGSSGTFQDEYITANSGGLNQPVFITFLAEQQVQVVTAPLNQPPTITSTNTPTVSENQTNVLNLSANDPENDTLSFSIIGGADDSKFTLDSLSGELNFIVAPDFETPSDFNADSIYEVEVRVQDGNGGTDTQLILVNVTNVNEAPIAVASSIIANEGDSIILNASSSTDPDFNSLSYSWDLDGNGSFGDVSGENVTVNWSTLQSFGINDNGIYTLGLQVSDGNGGVDTTTATLTVNNTAPTLSISGSTSIEQGAVYTLNLSATDPGNDTISSWTINWGDGSIDTIVGNPSTAEHIYLNGGFTNNILASAIDEDGTHLQNELFVPSYDKDTIFRFGPTGEYINETTTSGNTDQPVKTIVGPDGLLYIRYEGSNTITRHNALTGDFIDIFFDASAIQELTDVSGVSMAFGPDGNLYITDNSQTNNRIIQLDGTTGSYIKDFVPADSSNGLINIYDITFGTDNNLYVSDYDSHSIFRFDGDTGNFIDEFISSGSGGLLNPQQITFGPHNNLYVSSFGSNQILRFSGSNGDFIDTFIPSTNGGLDHPTGIAFGPDGNLYVADFVNNEIIRFEGSSGTLIDRYIPSGSNGLSQPVYLTFRPEQQVSVTLPLNQPPSITSLNSSVVDENQLNVLTVTASDLENDTLIFSIIGGVDQLKFTINATSGQLDYLVTPDFELPTDANANNIYEVEVRVEDTSGGFDTQLISIQVINVNEAPIASVDSFSVNEGATATLNLALNDSDADDGLDLSSITIVSAPAHGSIDSIHTDGSVTYHHDGSETATDTFSYSIKDISGAISNVVTVNLVITADNDTPVALADSFFCQ